MNISTVLIIIGLTIITSINLFNLWQNNLKPAEIQIMDAAVPDSTLLKQTLDKLTGRIEKIEAELKENQKSSKLLAEPSPTASPSAKATPQPSSTPKPTVTPSPTATPKTSREAVIYIGSGETTNSDWTDISSAVITLNTNNYPGIKAVNFEAGLAIVSGEARARLKNKTSGEITNG